MFQKLLARWVSEVWCKEHEPRGYCMTDGAFRKRWIKDQDWFGEAMEAALAYFQEARPATSVSRTDGHHDLLKPDHGGRDEGRRDVQSLTTRLIRSKLANKGEMTAHLDNIHQTLSELAVGNPSGSWRRCS